MSDLEPDDLFEPEPVVVWSDAEMARAVALIAWEADMEDLDERAPNYDW